MFLYEIYVQIMIGCEYNAMRLLFFKCERKIRCVCAKTRFSFLEIFFFSIFCPARSPAVNVGLALRLYNKT